MYNKDHCAKIQFQKQSPLTVHKTDFMTNTDDIIINEVYISIVVNSKTCRIW